MTGACTHLSQFCCAFSSSPSIASNSASAPASGPASACRSSSASVSACAGAAASAAASASSSATRLGAVLEGRCTTLYQYIYSALRVERPVMEQGNRNMSRSGG